MGASKMQHERLDASLPGCRELRGSKTGTVTGTKDKDYNHQLCERLAA